MANNVKCCITFITHKSKLEGYEEKSLKQCIKIFGGNRTIKLVLPKSISTEYYDEYLDKVEILKVKDEWLDSLNSYNYMSCDKNFWELFSEYNYVLIYQTDCWVFEDKLDHFIDMGYDWYGAPWPFWKNEVGNSGLCLRKVSKMLEITEKYTYRKGSMHDDVWFCRIHKKDMNICPWEIAVNFSLETVSNALLEAIKTIPMGFHGKDLIKLWDDEGDKFIKFKKSKLNKPFISVVTVNLNNKEGLEKTIKSVIGQSYFDRLEYVVIDGNSSDGSKDIIEKYKKYLSYYVSEEDKGIYNAMNKGIDAVNGEYTIFLNSGDYFHSSDIIEKVYNELDKDIVYGDLNIHKVNGKTFIKKHLDIIPNNFFKREAIPHEATFTKTELLKKKKFNENYKIISDTIFFYEAILKDKVSYKHIDYVITDFYLGGVSSNLRELVKEKNAFFKRNVDVFICTHKDFEPIVTNEAYKIIDAKRINNDKAENGLDGSFYSELMSYKYIYDNVPLKKYIGFCHYRKYFNFLDDIPDLDEIFSEYDCIAAKPLIYDVSIKEQYDTCHNIEDLYIVGGIIADKYPTYAKMWHNFIDGDLLVPYNMFIMKSEDFSEYIKFMFDILDEYVNIVGTNINKRIYDNYEKYIKDFYPNDTVEYQYRIGGYLGERLTNLFLMTHFNKMITYKVIVTENKYNEEKTNQD